MFVNEELMCWLNLRILPEFSKPNQPTIVYYYACRNSENRRFIYCRSVYTLNINLLSTKKLQNEYYIMLLVSRERLWNESY